MKNKTNISHQFAEVHSLIRQAKAKVSRTINTDLIELYWQIGAYVYQKIKDSEWGKSVVQDLSNFINKNAPDLKGFSAQNIWRMRQFYEAYYKNEKLSALLREISWTNNLLILSKSESTEEREFYIRLAKQEMYSSRELERQIDSGLYERTVTAGKNISAVLREIHPKAEQNLRDKYVVDFLSLPKIHSEQDLRKAIILNLKDFILEFGKDFTFVGEEYRLQVGNKDFYVDLLFYHRDLQCLVAFDLKITDFKPEYMGKMEFYLEALDKNVKKTHEKPSLGIILCKNHDSQVVQYALNRTVSPAMIAKYQTILPNKNLLEQKLEEFYLLEEPKMEYTKHNKQK
ncbi:MAG: PDDEXK nuclease domain-containing protein [Bacteroidales bacterium]|nr:PDDEXK nuclease domain-containing protein [Bacteroidales bacterium]MDD4236201.1 PDDEXK nuclease domain-containing protein [Bacteroidales bacterium]